MGTTEILARARRLLVSPRAEWSAIGAAPEGASEMALRYALVLCLGAPIAGLLVRIVLYGLVNGAGRGLLSDIVGNGVALGIVAALLGWLAPRFGGSGGFRRGMTVAAYGMTGAFAGSVLADVFALSPGLSLLAIVAGLIHAGYSLRLGAAAFGMSVPRRAGWLSASALAGSLLVTALLPSGGSAPAPAGFDASKLTTDQQIAWTQMQMTQSQKLIAIADNYRRQNDQMWFCSRGVGSGCGR